MNKKIIIILISALITGLSFAGTIKVNSPNGGENWIRGSLHNITWNSSGLTNPVKITLWKNGILSGLIVKDQPQNGSFSWTVGSHNGVIAEYGSDYKIKIREQGGSTFTTSGMSDNNFNIIEKKNPNIGIIQVETLKPVPNRHRAPPILEPSKASFSIEKIYYEVSSKGKLTNVKVMVTYKSETAFSFKNYKGHPQDGPVYMNCLIWNPKWPDGYPIYSEKGPVQSVIIFNQRLSVKYSGKNNMKCVPEILNIGSGMFQLIFTPSHSGKIQGLDTYQKMPGAPFSPSGQCKNSYPPKMAVRLFIHTREGVKTMYKEFYFNNTQRKTIPLQGETKSCKGGMVYW